MRKLTKIVILLGLFTMICVKVLLAQTIWAPNGVAVSGLITAQSPRSLTGLNGDVFVAWEDTRDGDYDIYAQRLDKDGNTLWGINGSSVATADLQDESFFDIASDGMGGMFVVYQQGPQGSYPGVPGGDVYITRIDGNGNKVFGNKKVSPSATTKWSPRICSINTGGAVVIWTEEGKSIVAQKIDLSGNALWTSTGIFVGNGDLRYYSTFEPTFNLVPIVDDHQNGVVVSWAREGVGVFAQRLNLIDGTPLWHSPSYGALLIDAMPVSAFPTLISDEEGNVVVSWMKYVYDSLRKTYHFDIYAQRIQPNGNFNWQVNGIPVCNNNDQQFHPRMVTDGAQGGIIIWQDFRSGVGDLYGQRVSSNGIVLWETNGIRLSTAASLQDMLPMALASDGYNQVIFSFLNTQNTGYNVMAQRLDLFGNIIYKSEGFPVSEIPGDESRVSMVQDNAGGAFITWEVNRRVYVQRIGAYDITSPSPITNLVSSNASVDSVTLLWTATGDDNTNGEILNGKYQIKYSTEKPVGDIVKWWNEARYEIIWATNTFAGELQARTAFSLENNTTYYFAVRVADEVGNWSNISNIASAQTLADIMSPAKITDLTISGTSYASLSLSWAATGDDENNGLIINGKYWLQYSTSGFVDVYSFVWSTNTSPGKKEFLRATNLTPGTAYSFRIKTADESDNWSEWSNTAAGVTLIDMVPPDPIVDLAAESVSDGAIYLFWGRPYDESGISHYRIFRSTREGVLGNLTTTTYMPSYYDSEVGLVHGASYYYTVEPVDIFNNIQIFGNTQVGALCDKVPPVTEWKLTGSATYFLETQLLNATSYYYYYTRPGNYLQAINAYDPVPGSGLLLTEAILNGLSIPISTYPYTIVSQSGFLNNDVSDTIEIASSDKATNKEAIINIQLGWDVTAPMENIYAIPYRITNLSPAIINVDGDERLLHAPEVIVTQSGLLTGTTIVMNSTDNGYRWQGEYSIIPGYDGDAVIRARSKDLVGYTKISMGNFNIEVSPEESLGYVYAAPLYFYPSKGETTSINYKLTQNADITISIFNSNNVLISSFAFVNQLNGNYQVQWNGKTPGNKILPDDTYTFQIKSVNPVTKEQQGLLKKGNVFIVDKIEFSFTQSVPVNAEPILTPNPEKLISDAVFTVSSKGFVSIGAIYEFQPEDITFQPSAILVMKWSDLNNNGIVDETEGTGMEVNETALDIYHIIPSSGVEKLNATPDYNTNKLTGKINSFSLYSILTVKAKPSGTSPVRLNLEPSTLNLNSKGEVITAVLNTVNGATGCFRRETIKISRVNGQPLQHPVFANAQKGKGDSLDCSSSTVKFNREAVIAVLPGNAVATITVSGLFADGRIFQAEDTIRTINPVRASEVGGGFTVSADSAFRLGEVYVYPNPAKGGKVPTFHVEVGIADSVKIWVYTVAGQLAHERFLTGTPLTVGSVYAYEYAWEGRIASGVYYYTIEAERAGKKLKAKGKFAVIR